MCGIIGYLGTRPVTPILMAGLTHLEYRGYDSAGVALMTHDGIAVVRSVGRIAALEEATKEMPLSRKRRLLPKPSHRTTVPYWPRLPSHSALV